MTYRFKTTIKPMLITCIASTALSLAACEQPKTETQPVQSSQQISSALKVAHVDAKGAQALLTAKPEAIVLDVRTPKELESGFIEGAVFANFYDEDFAEQLTKFDRDTPYIVHCKGGGRSTKALSTLEELGFTNVTHMDGGLDGWKREKLPLTKP